jgi:hypothetical chaperone protein
MGGEAGVALGVDFGTTNTVVAVGNGEGGARAVRFPTPGGGEAAAFRSVLSVREEAHAIDAGAWAIEAFLDDPESTRLIQSFKSFAASSAFSGTSIFGRRFQFEDLLFAFLRRLWARSEGLDGPAARTVIGRPVMFAGADPNEGLALRRYATAFGRLGLPGLSFAYEPVAAAFFFAKRLESSATVLVADFGGGTSDFSIMRFRREAGGLVAEPLSRSGVGVAGDAFDFRIIDHVVSPRLGKGGEYRSDGKRLPVPNRYYAAFARWNQLALMKGSRDMRDLRQIARTAVDPAGIGRFIDLLESDQGYELYRAVSAAKETLSEAETARFSLKAGRVEIEVDIARVDFECWIVRELEAIERAVDRALESAGIGDGGVDKVFLTGGSSFVPAVRAIFLRRFGADAIETGGEFESIATGLALIGSEPDAKGWSQPAGL